MVVKVGVHFAWALIEPRPSSTMGNGGVNGTSRETSARITTAGTTRPGLHPIPEENTEDQTGGRRRDEETNLPSSPATVHRDLISVAVKELSLFFLVSFNIDSLLASSETRELRPNEAAVKRGERVGGVFIVASGCCSMMDPAGKTVLSDLRPGDMFGEVETFMNSTAPADVIASER